MIWYVGSVNQTKPQQVEVARTTTHNVFFADGSRDRMTSEYRTYRPSAREWHAWRVGLLRSRRDDAVEMLNARELDLDEAERLLREEEQSNEKSM